MSTRTGIASLVLAVCVVGVASDAASAALAKQNGLSGLSGKLSSNAGIRKQQLICDPAAGTEGGAIDPTVSPLAQGAPRRGSDSVNYNPSIVSLSGVDLGTGYAGSGRVEVEVAGGGHILQDLESFLKKPAGSETGYVQLFFHHGNATGTLPPDNLFGPKGEPGLIPVAKGFDTNMSDGLSGFDTHSFTFTYKPGVAPTAIAAYDIFADTGGRSSGNSADFLTGLDVTNGKEFTIPASQIAAAHVQGALVSVPLPRAAWAGSATLGAVGLVGLIRRRRLSRR